ncbi:threonine synthase [Thiotrichales bacterium 19S3-7]|nr:threonine synthase [Thiotrichales bacterium 19S3-7]MCF6801346.1 threonine synthase [Thiotrichales bacterium 19S3-11]
MYHLIDFNSKKTVTTDDFVFAGENSPWQVEMDLERIKKQINLDYFINAQPCLSKYLPLMPIKHHANFVSLRETATPLLKSKVIAKKLGIDLYFKVEGKNPTGSFKDRGSAVDITLAKEMGAKGVVLASTGNMAASCSCYAAAANMPCFIVVPEGVSMSKLAQVISFGGKIIQVKGTYNDAAELAYKIAKSRKFYLAGDYAFRVEGQKTAAFEIIDQLLFQVPDEVIVPVGCGTNITAYKKGFDEYNALGLIDKMPKISGVQASGANSLVRAFRENRKSIVALDYVDTIATAISVPYPIDGDKALDAIYQTKGQAIEVTDTDMLKAQYELSTLEGLFVESASAATVAYLYKQFENGTLEAGKKMICILSGDGLKDPNVVLKSAIQPPVIYPNESDFDQLYDNQFFDNKSMLFVEKDLVVFSQLPTLLEVKQTLSELLDAKYNDQFVEKILKHVSDFLTKGKAITISDLQDIVQDAREMANDTLNNNQLTIQSFNVTTAQNKLSKAEVTVKVKEQLYYASHEGVGPVDATIQALARACPGDVSYKLTDYKVQIRGEGSDAVVFVELKMLKDGHHVMGKAISPDIIQASVEAFIDAYNSY